MEERAGGPPPPPQAKKPRMQSPYGSANPTYGANPRYQPRQQQGAAGEGSMDYTNYYKVSCLHISCNVECTPLYMPLIHVMVPHAHSHNVF